MTRIHLLSVCLAATLVHAACSRDPEVIKREALQQGDAHFAQGRYSEAMIEYRRALQQDPSYGAAHDKLGQVYNKTGDLANAVQSYIRAADAMPDNTEAQLRAGELLLLGRQFEDAKSRAEKVLQRDPKNVGALVLRANALARLDKLDNALKDVEDAIQNDPNRALTYANLGAVQLLRGEQNLAEVAFKRAVDADPRNVPARLALANFFWSTNRSVDAEGQLNAVLGVEPKNALANQALAYLYLATGRKDNAEVILKTLAADNVDGTIRLADFYLGIDRSADARKLLEELARTDNRGTIPAKLRLAGMSVVTRDTDTASRLLDEVLAKEPRNTDALVGKSQLLRAAGRLDDALTAARQAVAVDANLPKSQYELGRVFTLRDDFKEAEAAFAEAVRLRPRYAQAQLELARLRLAQGKIQEGEQLVRSALSEIAGYAEAHLLLARIEIMKGRPAQAETSLKALERSFPSAAGVQTELGNLYMIKRNPQAARTAYERALLERPGHVEALAGLMQLDFAEKRTEAIRKRAEGLAVTFPKDVQVLLVASQGLLEIRDLDAAERVARQAVTSNPNNMDSYAWLGQVYGAQGKLAEATQEFERVADKTPSSVAAQTIAGILFNMQGKSAEARARYEKAVLADPHAAVAANNLAWMYMHSDENLDKALALAQTAKSVLPNRPEVNDTLGLIYLKKKLYSSALDPLRQAATSNPKSALYQYHLGLAYAGTGDRVKARLSLEKALSLDPKFLDADAVRKALEGLKG